MTIPGETQRTDIDPHIVPTPLRTLDNTLMAVFRNPEREVAELAMIRAALSEANRDLVDVDEAQRPSPDDSKDEAGSVVLMFDRRRRPALAITSSAEQGRMTPAPIAVATATASPSDTSAVVHAAHAYLVGLRPFFLAAGALLLLGLVFFLNMSGEGDGPFAADQAATQQTMVASAVTPISPAANPGPDSEVSIDASQTSISEVRLSGREWADARQRLTVRLGRGAYNMDFSAGDAIQFTVGNNGRVDYKSDLDSMLSGRGTSTLIVWGSTVNLDATDLDYTSVDVHGTRLQPTAKTRNFRLLPGRHEVVRTAGDPIQFTVGNNGRVNYDSSLDGVMSGRDSTTLALHGLPVAIDATATDHPSFQVAGVGPRNSQRPQVVRLLPGKNRITFMGWRKFDFTLAVGGFVDYEPSLGDFLSGRGTTTLTIIERHDN